jgi:hypothetical protein
VSESQAAFAEPEVAADLMLRNPKTLAADATVAEVREQLDNPRVQMVLLADGEAFKGAVTRDPGGRRPGRGRPRLRRRQRGDDLTHRAGAEAFDRTAGSPSRRVIVLDEDRNLLGLLCLDPSLTRFCGAQARVAR